MKKGESGITLVALAITIIVLLILSSVAISTGSKSIQNGKVTRFTAEMKILQSQVNTLYEKYNNNGVVTIGQVQYKGKGDAENSILGIQDIGNTLSGNANQSAYNSILQNCNVETNKYANYKIYDKNLLNSLGVENIEGTFLVSVIDRDVISTTGIDYNGTLRYRLNDLPGGSYNVDYNENTANIPTIENITSEYLGENKWKITASNVQYDGYIKKWNIKYKLQSETNWNNSQDMSFIVSNQGTYEVKAYNENIETSVINITVNVPSGTFDKDKGVNAPKLLEGMTGVYWDSNGNEVTVTENNKNEWYDYSHQKWANAKTQDESYWVWIPRFAYKITTNLHTNSSTGGTILIDFLQDKGNTGASGITRTGKYQYSGNAMTDYVIHPSFRDGRANNYANGEWDAELSGYWVAKYEMSNSNGVPKSVPGVQSWRENTISDMYTHSLNYDDNIIQNNTADSHLMKNSEWGAVAYLSQSRFGRDGIEVTVNSNPSYYTAGGSGATATTNVNQSTTGNASGIFDMSGCTWEYVSAYEVGSGGLSSRTDYGSSFATSNTSNKYVTVYPSSANDTNTDNYSIYYNDFTSRYGDAILETSINGSDSNGWFSDYSTYPFGTGPFFLRGGINTNGLYAGLFYFNYGNGTNYSNRLRFSYSIYWKIIKYFKS